MGLVRESLLRPAPTQTGSAPKTQGLSKPSAKLFNPASVTSPAMYEALPTRAGREFQTLAFHFSVTSRVRSDSVAVARARQRQSAATRSTSWEDKALFGGHAL